MIFWQAQSALGSDGSREPLNLGFSPSLSPEERGGEVAGALTGHGLPGTPVRLGGRGEELGKLLTEPCRCCGRWLLCSCLARHRL